MARHATEFRDDLRGLTADHGALNGECEVRETGEKCPARKYNGRDEPCAHLCTIRKALVFNDEAADGEFVLTLSDDRGHAGREVAVDAATLEDATGTKPEMTYGLHESGDEWTSEISYENGYAVFEVPTFSSNTVPFTGGVSIVVEGPVRRASLGTSLL